MNPRAAEGVEDQATLDLLREMGATQAQGYYFAKPMGLEELLVMLPADGSVLSTVQSPIIEGYGMGVTRVVW
jgi:predicted signal transduction protein with EAL and GGDEF domain